MGRVPRRRAGPHRVLDVPEGSNSEPDSRKSGEFSELDGLALRHRGTYSVVFFSPDPRRAMKDPLGVVLASNELNYLGCRIRDDAEKLSPEYGSLLASISKDLSLRFSPRGLKTADVEPEEFLREQWHDAGNSVYLTEPRDCLFWEPEANLSDLFLLVLDEKLES